MDNLLKIVTFFSELLGIMICVHAFFDTRIVWNKLFFCALISSSLLLYLANIRIIPSAYRGMGYAILLGYSFLKFRKKLWITITKFAMALVSCVLVEALISSINILLQKQVDMDILLFAGSIVFLTFMCVFGNAISHKILFLDYKKDKKFQYIALFYGVIVSIIVVDYNFSNIPLRISMISVLLCVFIGYFFMQQLIRKKTEEEKKKLELDLQKIYGETYLELSSNVRKRQHDFKNQLSAIYSTHLTATSMEELISMQKSYGEKLQENCRYDSILTNCNQPILAGYLYQKCLACEAKGIQVDYDICVEHVEEVCSLHEMIEILGILWDNAIENFEFESILHSKIELCIKEDAEQFLITVANPSHRIKHSEIQEMFTEGYSTKGKNRGLGLARLKELTKLYHMDVIVETYLRENYNWLCFKIQFKK